MATRVRDILKRRATESFVGRKEEKDALLKTLEENGPLVVFVHGIAGIGKTSLLETFSEEARLRGATVVRLDCRSMEPTERGFLHELSTAIGSQVQTADEAAERLGRLGQRVVLVLDTYELFRLMDTWLRQVFIPALPDNVRVIFSGREAPVSAWLTSREWEGLFRTVPLGSLGDKDALELLSYGGVNGVHAKQINRITHGHPLALRLVSSALTERLAANLEHAAIQRVVEELTRLYLSDVPDPLTRKALEATSVIRCATQSLLKEMLPEMAPQDAFERLRALPFVTSGRDGLFVHDAVREVIAASLKASDPNAYRDYRRAAWRQLRTEVRSAGMTELWRYTADMLYILENPVIREAFFPSGVHEFAVEPAGHKEDDAAIRTIIEQEGSEASRLLKNWWQRAPETFYSARDSGGKASGFISIFDPTTVNPALLRDDPILRAFSDHLQRDPVPKNQRVLFGRRWLSLGYDEMVSPATAACFLDTKRMYMTMRPNLRRVYATICDLQTLGPLFSKLGFKFLEKSMVKLDGVSYNIIMLDMGPASTDGWIAGLVAAELGVEEGGILDIDARELVLDGQRVTLTPLEFGVIHYLYQHSGKAVSRASLIENVWGYSGDGGSNVIDTVILSLRKKLGERSSLIETVRGVGYRFREG
ncbi:MAG: hypothetical protein A2Z28_05080 [Chloroflexi bacterium RBG_16_51_9]|nr:MAG: hypothetical protein A2Z28_05080 [Chloroflexi bacterium RBG_16_51_9]